MVDIKKLRELHEKATAGPWEIPSGDDGKYIDLFWGDYDGIVHFQNEADRLLIMEMRNALPELLDELESLQSYAAHLECSIGG